MTESNFNGSRPNTQPADKPKRSEQHLQMLRNVNLILDGYMAQEGRLLTQMEIHDLFLLASHHYWPERAGAVAEQAINMYLAN